MRLALNTFVYEVAQVPVEQALQSALRFGFTFIEYAAIDDVIVDIMEEGA